MASVSSCPSSSPLPSPRTILRQLRAKTAAKQTAPTAAPSTTDTWEIPDSDGEPSLPPAEPPKPKAIRKPRATAAKKAPAKPRKPRATKIKKSASLEVEQSDEEVKSKYFSDKPAATLSSVWKSGKPQKAVGKKTAPPEEVVMIPETPAHSPPEGSPQPAEHTLPPKRTSKLGTIDTNIPSSPPFGSPVEEKSFGDMVAAFKCAWESSSAEIRNNSREQSMAPAPLRKTPIEMLEFPNPTRKPKAAPVRKPRKTTRKAVVEPSEAAASSPITKFFPAKKATSGTKAPKKPKAPSKSTKKKKEEDPAVPLLSPNSAQNALQDQAFVFGTLSQLEQGKEKDIKTLDLSAPAQKEETREELVTIGNFMQRDPEEGLWDTANGQREIQDGWQRLISYKSTLNDFDGLPMVFGGDDSFEAHMSHEPVSQERSNESVSIRGRSLSPIPFDNTISSSPLTMVRGFSTSTASQAGKPRAKTTRSRSSSPKATPTRATKRKSMSSSPTRSTTLSPGPAPRSPSPKPTAAKRTRKAPAKKAAAPVDPNRHPDMPDYKAFTIPQLQPMVQAYGFKKTASKATLVATLEACWLAKHNSEPLPTPPNPKRRASRSRSRSTSPRRRASSVARRGNKERPVVDTDERLSQATLYLKITDAVKMDGVPAKRDESFWSRILMYDPVIVEDLTVWLNTVGLGRVGVDEEVTVAEVRDWCDSRSVACASRETHKKKERKRY